jgi:uncharacterized protein (TIGR02099 family)
MPISFFFRRCINGLWYVGAYSIIAFALLMSVLRLLIDDLDVLKPDIERFIQEKSGAGFEVRDMHFSWRSSGPALQLQGMDIKAPDNSLQVNIRNGLIVLDFWRSLWYLEPITASMEFQGVQLQWRESDDDDPEPDSNSQQDINQAVAWLLKQKNIELYDAYLLWTSINGKRLSLATPLWIFHGSAQRQQMKGSLTTPQGGRMEVRLDHRLAPDSSGKLYLSVKQLSLAEWPLRIFGREFQNLRGLVDADVWGQWNGGRLEKLVLHSAVQSLTLTGTDPKVSVPDVWAVWRREDQDRWRFVTSDITIKPFQTESQAFHLEGWRWSDSHGVSWHMTGLRLPLELVRQWGEPLLSSELGQKLKQSDLVGDVTRLSATITENKEGRLLPTIYAQLRGIGMKADGFGIGLAHVDVDATVRPDHATARLSAANGQLVAPSLFGRGIAYRTIRSAIEWNRKDDNAWTIAWPSFSLESDDLHLTSRGRFELKAGTPHLSMVGGLEHLDLKNVRQFLPDGVMSANLVSYLANSLESGRLDQATVVYRGDIGQFPYPNSKGVFDAVGVVDDVDMKFSPHWPNISNLHTELRFNGERMDIENGRGMLDGLSLDGLEAHIPVLSAEPPLLSISTRGQGLVEDMLSMLSRSPLKTLAQQLQPLHWSGKMSLQLALNIPLDKNNKTTLKGRVDLLDNRISLEAPALVLDAISGPLRFNESGLVKAQVTGQWLGRPWTATLRQKETAAGVTVDGLVKARIGAEELASLLPLAAPADQIKGETELTGHLAFTSGSNAGASHLRASFESQLQGLELNLPEPFDKQGKISAPIHLDVRTGKQTRLELNWPDRLQARLQLTEGQTPVGTVAIGQTDLPEHDDNQLKLRARLNRLALTEWLHAVQWNTGSSAHSLPAVSAQLTAKTVDLGDLKLGPLSLEVQRPAGNDPWSVAVRGEKLQGTATVPLAISRASPLQVHLEHWFMDWQDASSAATGPIPAPASWPYTTFTCLDCRARDLKLGRVDVRISGQNHVMAWHVNWQPLDEVQTEIDGRWDSSSTRLVVDGTGNSFHKLTQWLGFNTGIRKSGFKVNMALLWPGAPWQYKLDDVKGTASITLGKGYLEEVSDQGARLFTLFSFQSLRRRLALDFSDVFNKGFYFDGIQGKFTLNRARLMTQGLHVEGTAAGVDISGITNLSDYTTEQAIVVTPKLSSSLPVLAGWAVSPATAVIAYVLDKLFIKPALDVVTRIDYRLTGPLDSPEMLEVGKQKAEVQVDADTSD